MRRHIIRKTIILTLVFLSALYIDIYSPGIAVLAAANEFVMMPGLLIFTDITNASGTGGPDWHGGHGVQFADVTADGLPDFYVTMNLGQDQDMGDLFYGNIDGATFVEEAYLRGIENFDSGSHGSVWADLDNDGDYDLFNGSYERNRIYRNDGLGFFTDVTYVSGIPNWEWPTRGVVAFDMDEDGDLDLFAVNGSKGSGDPSEERNEFYCNDGNMQFTTIDSGVLFTAPAGQGATDSDFDGDGDIDIFAANTYGDVNIIRNDGNGNFTLVSPASLGIAHHADDGITLADVNNDGHLDILLEKNLYMNNGNNTYTFLNTFSAPGYMGGFEDLDNDGDWDLVFPGDNKVYFNDGIGNFTASPTFSLGTINDPRCVAFADIDNDGDVDFFYAQKRTYNRMIRNDYDGNNKWLRVRLVRANGQAGAYGAKVYIYEAGKMGNNATLIAWREARSQEGYLGQNDPSLHFGVAEHSTVDVRVVFLGGITVDLSNVPTSQMIDITESEAPTTGGLIGGGGGSSGGCFIATATYGSALSDEVDVFRQFRDEYLLANELGRAFVSVYYKYSPSLADYIAKHSVMRKTVRIGLYPMLKLSKWLVGENSSE